MAEEEKSEAIMPELPLGRVKKLVKLDRDINKKKRRTVKLEHLRIAAKKHRPTRDFLLDSLPVPSQPSDRPPADRIRPQPAAEKPLPAGTRRIDDFFRKPEKEKPSECNSLDKRFSSVKDSEGVAALFQALKESCSSAPLVDVQEP
ncbi:hypothetical protein CK203_030671 [Vitis vinifera]|uniref:Uncharacterized protein n=1 Tax=Vitis vinifera TaxID=29760 RepID=A0A438IRD5_VITVI|nr:hypothetical protein CK203_030671 [Vitis vinifera]